MKKISEIRKIKKFIKSLYWNEILKELKWEFGLTRKIINEEVITFSMYDFEKGGTELKIYTKTPQGLKDEKVILYYEIKNKKEHKKVVIIEVDEDNSLWFYKDYKSEEKYNKNKNHLYFPYYLDRKNYSYYLVSPFPISEEDYNDFKKKRFFNELFKDNGLIELLTKNEKTEIRI